MHHRQKREDDTMQLEMGEIEIIGDSVRGDWSPPPSCALAHPGNWGTWLLEGGTEAGARGGRGRPFTLEQRAVKSRSHYYDIAAFISRHHLEADPGLL